MLSLAEARALIQEVVRPLPVAPAALAIALGRVLGEDVLAPEDQPAFDRSAMDGYAVNADDASAKFRVVLEVQPGEAPKGNIGAGECARIFTGAQIPEGASQVIMQEDVERDGEWMMPRTRDRRTWIRYRGEDARQGALLLKAGTRLGSGELSLLAQVGVVQPRVFVQPRVLHIATGNELVDPGSAPGPSQIRDSNSTLVAGLVAEIHASLAGRGHCRDGRELLIAEVQKHAADSWDVLLISGGASVGDYDFGMRVLEELGFQVHFRQLNLRPGKPLVFATRDRQVAFVIPGNPVSHFVTFQVAIRLAFEYLEGASPSWVQVRAALAEDLKAKPNPRDTMWPAQVRVEGGELTARPLVWQSSGDLSGLVGANALIPIVSGAGGGLKGERVEVLLLGRLG